MIFFGFGSPRFLLFFLLLFLLGPLFLYSPGVALVVGGIVLLAALGSGTSGRRRERAAPRVEEPLPDARPFEEVREAAEEDLLALADGIRALDIDVELPGASPAARQDYERALDLYDAAKRAFDRARAPSDFEPASVAVEEGRFAIASAQARLEGRAPPERRPPCFFDQRHGPSVRDVAWAPPGGTTRPVPACAADAIRIEEGEAPSAREVMVGGRSVPYWDAPAYYGPGRAARSGPSARSCRASSSGRCSVPVSRASAPSSSAKRKVTLAVRATSTRASLRRAPPRIAYNPTPCSRTCCGEQGTSLTTTTGSGGWRCGRREGYPGSRRTSGSFRVYVRRENRA